MNIPAFTPGVTPKAHSFSGQTSSAFAQDIMRRAVDPASTPRQMNIDSQNAAPDAEREAQKRMETRGNLESALAGTIDFVNEKFGSKAATTVMGIVYKRVGDNAVTEENLGQGLVDAARFIDRQLGIQAGDDFISQLNGSLNNGLNAFFENGKTEQFLVSSPTDALGKLSVLPAENTENALENLKNMLETMQNDMKKDEENQDPYTQQKADSTALENGVLVDTLI